MISNITVSDLKKAPWRMRINTFKALKHAGSGHVGPCLSIAEILACLFFKEININNKTKSKDYFVLSKGHGVPMLYSLFVEIGLLDLEELYSLRQVDSRLQGHPDMLALDLLDSGSGALGQGLSISIGYALAQQLVKSKNFSYCLVGDGEMQEGQIWEAILYAGVKKINNLCVILDNNKFQNEISVADTLGEIDFEAKLKSFGWNYVTIDGHSIDEIQNALVQFKSSERPFFIDAQTIKGKGVDFMENNNSWHSKVLDQESFENAIAQCERELNAID